MKEDEIQIGISSTLVEYINAHPKEYTIKEIADKICYTVMQFLSLSQKDKTKHTVLRLVYSILDKLMEETKASEKTSCRKGCAFCCKMNVDVTPMEADLIIDYCEQKNIPIDQQYLQLQAAVPKHELAFHPMVAACAFLSEDNTCRIYPVRPVACRKYLVISPAENCDIKKYPDAMICASLNVPAEIVTSAVDSIQLGVIGSLPKLLLRRISESA
jgi:Fe-S-cluster containining protein